MGIKFGSKGNVLGDFSRELRSIVFYGFNLNYTICDISTKTIGWSLFDINTRRLLELTHFSPVVKPQPEDKIEELLGKVDAFEKILEGYRNFGITKVIIEEPLLNSNNIWTVGTLLRYNSMLTKSIYDILGVVPKFISTYNSRKYAWPELVGPNDKNKN